MNKKLNKKLLFLLFSFPLIALPIGLSTLNNTFHSISLVNRSLNINESTTDDSINLENALPVADQSIKSFGDYIVSYEDNNVYPVNVVLPMSSSELVDSSKAGGATVGMTENKQTITLTTYAGLLLWSHKLVDNQLLKQYYSEVKSVNDISSFKVINFAYLESKNILFVLFGEETNTSKTNLVVFGLDINSGSIVVPSAGKLADNQVIAQVRDNSTFIFFNSSDQLLVTSGDTVSDIANSSKIMSFDVSGAGFANVKGNDDSTNNFGTLPVSTSSPAVANVNDYFLGFLPSSQKGLNYSLWLYSPLRTSGSGNLSYATGIGSSTAKSIVLNKYFNYYVLPLSDNFTVTNNGFTVVNNNSRGYLSSTFPKYEDIYKRFFYTGLSETSGTTTESLGILLDSDDDMFSSFVNFKYTVNTGSSPTVTAGSGDMFMNYSTATLTAPQKADLPADLASDADVSNYEFNSVGYDKESNFVYFSLSGAEETGEGNAATANGKYLTNTRYVDLKSENLSKAVSSDAYIEDNPYTLSDVNFETYADQDNLYLTKQTIEGDRGQWLSTTVTDFNDDQKDFEPTKSAINFSSIENFSNELKNSKDLNNVMPSLLGNNLKSLDKFLNDKGLIDIVKFTSATGNDETGEINLQAEITYENDFGDNVEDNGFVSYVSYIHTIGFTSEDFSWNFMQDTESAVVTIKEKFNAQKIIETNNKGWVIQNLLKEITVNNQVYDFENWSIPEDDVTLSSGASNNSLKVEINVPIKQIDENGSITDGILPVGFPKNEAIVSVTYNGFSGDSAPPFVRYPNSSDSDDNSNNSNFENALNGGTTASIVIGCLALSAIIVAVIIVLKSRIKLNKKV